MFILGKWKMGMSVFLQRACIYDYRNLLEDFRF